MKRLSRRTLLRGGGGLALSLPLLEAMLPSASAQAADTPRRILFEFKANGDQTARRFTNTTETGFQFDEFLAPLEPYRDEVLFLNRLDKRFRQLGQEEQSDGHQQGGSALAPWPSGAGSYPIGGTDRKIGYVLGPSADHAIGDRVLAGPNPPAHRHLVYRVGQKNNDIWNLHSHAGPQGTQSPVPPETDPYAAYARIFTFNDDPAAQAALLRRLKMQQSALDLVLEETTALEARLGADDRQRMEQHTEAIRDIERTLSGTKGGASCGPIELGAKLDPYNNDNYLKIGHLFFDIMTLAFACDLTRVVQFNWSGNTNNRVYKTLGLSAGHHDISHEGTPESFVNIRKIHKHLWESTLPLYEKLKAAGEGGSSVWANTLVVHWNELGQGDSHTIRDNLVVLAGGAGGYFRRGRMLDFNNQASFADMLVSCFHYMGFEDVTSFGDPRLQQTGALAGLT